MSNTVIGFLGAGQMARALAGGFVRAGLAAAADIVAYDPSSAAAEQFAAEIRGARWLPGNANVAEAADIVFLAVKPSHVGRVATDLEGRLNPERLLVSIAAGIGLARLAADFGTDRVIRVMPNTPCLIGQGAAGFSLGSGATDEDAQTVGRLLNAVGIAFQVDEPLLDAVTGLSGSGPAFVYTVIEALADGGVRMGLPRAIAAALAAQTVRGAAGMVLASDDHPAVLRDRVASPGGTTIAGIQALEHHGLRAALMAAVEAAARRSMELGAQ
jgi:pyrroline-5-carboxylate reductase